MRTTDCTKTVSGRFTHNRAPRWVRIGVAICCVAFGWAESCQATAPQEAGPQEAGRRVWGPRATSHAQESASEQSESQKSESQKSNAQEQGSEKAVPELSLESLFHPTKKHAYVTPVPSTHWLEGTPSQLLIKREDRWKQYDIAAGKEKEWPVYAMLVAQLRSLEGVSDEKANAGALQAVGAMKHAKDTVLVRLDDSLAIVTPGGPTRWLTRDAKRWRNATLGPFRRRVAYNVDGDLFLLDTVSGRTMRLTRDGSDTLLDGILDWTYQEEIFGRGNFKGFWFSPDGLWLAMLRVDISGIEPYTLASTSSERGKGVVSRYPKAGDPIPHASLFLWDLRQADRGVIPPARLLAQSTPQEERIVTGVWWHEKHRALIYAISDRRQTWRELWLTGEEFFQNANASPMLLLREESPAWVEPPSEPGWMNDGSLIWRSELPTGRNRLYHIAPGGAVVTPLTPESLDVQDFEVRSDGAFAIVSGDANGDTTQRHLYRVNPDPAGQSGPTIHPITVKPGWHATRADPNVEYVVDTFTTESSPAELWVRSVNGGESKRIAASELSVPGGMIESKVFRIPTPDGLELPAMLVRPKTDAKCPVVIEVYGGPQAPVVTARFSANKVLYRELLARSGIATLVVDNRSSAGRGIADTWSVRGRFGEVELKDLLTATEWLRSQSWVDSDRLAVRGWSFGGFLTLYAMTHSDVFAAGIAGGSVSDWREYDAFYTERYMDLPSRNPAGYDSTSPIAAAAQLHGDVLLIHGEADDNVHPTGTMRMASALQEAGKDFQLMIYPGAAHAIRKPGQVWHMSKMTDRFLRENLLNRKD